MMGFDFCIWVKEVVNGCLGDAKEESESRFRYVSEDEEWEDQNES